MSLKIDPKIALKKVDAYLEETEVLLGKSYKEGEGEKSELWLRIEGFLNQAFEDGTNKINQLIGFHVGVLGYVKSSAEEQRDYEDDLNKLKRHLMKYREEINLVLESEKPPIISREEELTENNAIEDIKMILSRFDKVVRQLGKRHRCGKIFEVKNEYDVQHLLHALLKIFFDDISTEVAIPGGVSGHTIMDFLLKSEEIAIEVKKTREGLSNVELRRQLNDDIPTYKTHPDCDTLIFFIYDPDNIIENPIRFEKEFNERTTDDFRVLVYITPK
jgi:hypothetical protein